MTNKKFTVYGYSDGTNNNLKALVDTELTKAEIDKILNQGDYKMFKDMPSTNSISSGLRVIFVKDEAEAIIYSVNASMKLNVSTINKDGLESKYFTKRVQILGEERYSVGVENKVVTSGPIKYSQEGEAYSGTTGKLTTCQEEKFLAAHINYYLPLIGLKQINMETLDTTQNNPLYFLSTLGDSRLYLDMLNKITDRKLLQFFNTNAYQKSILVRFGFPEFVDLDEHVCGTILEALYEIAYLQNNALIQREILEALVGEHIKSKSYSIDFV